MISDNLAAAIASQYHNGQGSPAYSFSTTGTIEDVDGLVRDLKRDLTEDQKGCRAMVELEAYIRAAGPRGAVSGFGDEWEDPMPLINSAD